MAYDEVNCELKDFVALVEDLREKEFWGELLVKFKEGKIIVCKKTESIRLKA